MSRTAPAIAFVAALALTGCSGSSEGTFEDERTAAPASDGIPDCDDVWTAGQTMPDSYRQCHDDAGRTTGVVGGCADGIRYLGAWDKYYAFTGDVIQELPAVYAGQPDRSPEFASAVDECADDR